MTEPLKNIIPFALARMRLSISDAEDKRRRAAWRALLDKQRIKELEDNVKRRAVPTDDSILRVVYNEHPHQNAMFTKVVARSFNPPGTADIVFVPGGTGSGKTSGISWIIARHPLSALYATASQLCETRNAGNYQFLDLARTVNLLGVDELGLEYKPSAIVELLVHRFDHGLITMLLGNVTREMLGERYSDPRLRSRTASIKRDVIIELGDPDLRVSE